ncbi:hypothetical protein L5515_000851 [Caenorhabditis briggsae]|uniref:Protein CBR-TPXL-1 n=1 Tax=Caenorhabditis briggsae TaxID=6238 RepID=A0AAE9E0R2_CAEBR|nr:hypothetical protein L5515_000851 [Caenorhabditis briggsae]
MSKNQTIQEFDENFFSSIAVPKVKDYSRLSSSPSRDQPCDSSYFEKHFPNLECDTPVKMRLPAVNRNSDDALPAGNMDNFLSSSASSETTVNAEQQDTTSVKQQPSHNNREPLKIVPNEAAIPAQSKVYGESQLIEGLEKLTMFAPKEPEERLSQRRRSEQKKRNEEEENKRRSGVPASSVNRARSISTKRSISREPSSTTKRESSIPRSRHNSVTRTISAPINATATGVVTRAMAARAAETSTKPLVRRSVMPLKVAQKTPVSTLKKETAPGSGDRSRDRTRRTNTTGTSVRRSVMPVKPSGAATPVAPPRRSASATRAPVSVSKMTPKNRPIATANRSSILRMNTVKPTAPPVSITAESEAQPKKLITRPAVPTTATTRIRQPLRVNPSTPSSMAKKPAMPSSGQRPARVPHVVTRARSVDRSAPPPPAASTPSASKVSRADLFNRLATPKSTATPARISHDGPNASIRKSAVRPVPSYVYSVNKGYEKTKTWVYCTLNRTNITRAGGLVIQCMTEVR